MKHLPTLFLVAVAATLSVMAGLSNADIFAAVNASPSVSIVRLANVKGNTWPGDFNGDGFTDLAIDGNAARPGDDVISVLLGDGHGNFAAAPTTGAQVQGAVHGVGDFNNDGRLDAIVEIRTTPSTTSLSILRGIGNGTFGQPSSVDEFSRIGLALSADLDGDGRRDLVASDWDSDQVRVYRGLGNFQFDPAGTLTAGLMPNGGILADFNGDGKRDLAVANLEGNSVSVFKNAGAFTFTAADIPLDRHASDATAADVNGDGKLDLIVSGAGSTGGLFGQEYIDGVAYVLEGHGDGTFAAPVSYPTVRGAYQIVVGDFTRDGIIDIATGNRSTVYRDDCGPGAKTWDSLSILPGNGNGTFAAASSFSVGNQMNVDSERFRNTLSSLTTSDIDADGATDLIVSHGVIFKNRPTDPNWAPTVTATATEPGGGRIVFIKAAANDVDQDMLTYSWTDSSGSPIPPIPSPCLSENTRGIHTFTVTVDDQHGHTASSSVTVDFGSIGGTPPTINVTAPAGDEVVAAGSPYTIKWTTTVGSAPIDRFFVSFSPDDGAHYALVPGCSNLPASATSCTWSNPNPPTETARLFVLAIAPGGPSGNRTTDPFSIRTGSTGGTPPAPWQQQDVGATGAAGSATHANGVFSVKGSGADIWATADEFHYLYRVLNGAAGGPTDMTTRVDSVQNVNAWTKAGLMFRSTLEPNSPHASIFVTPGKGVAFQRRTSTGGTSVSTSASSITAPVWLRLTVSSGEVRGFYKKNATDAWTELGVQPFSGWVSGYGGLAVTSHADGTLATAAFSNVTVAPTPAEFGNTVLVGGATGSATSDANTRTYTLTDRGADIWGTADQFTFTYKPWSGDGQAVVDVRSLTNTNAWTKGGVMFRSTTAANSAHVSLFVTPGKGIAMQYRPGAGAASLQVAPISGVAPVFLRLTRSGNSYVGAWSSDLSTWHTVGSVSVAVATDALAGMALTSHNTTSTATAVFVDPTVSR